MTTIFDEETEEQSAERFERETAGIGGRIEPQGEVLPPPDPAAEDDPFPLESLITVELCGLLFSLPGSIQARRTGHEFWLLDQEEKTLIGTASQPLMVYLVRRWIGDGIGMYAATAAAAAAIYLPRQMRETMEQAAEKRRAQRGPQDGPQDDPNDRVRRSSGESQPSSANGDAGNPANNDDWGIRFQE
jgi:hypothetical protein